MLNISFNFEFAKKHLDVLEVFLLVSMLIVKNVFTNPEDKGNAN